jgi:hypothetical protein
MASTVEAAKHQAEKLPFGKERDHLLRKARHFETRINEWMSSPALHPPR